MEFIIVLLIFAAVAAFVYNRKKDRQIGPSPSPPEPADDPRDTRKSRL